MTGSKTVTVTGSKNVTVTGAGSGTVPSLLSGTRAPGGARLETGRPRRGGSRPANAGRDLRTDLAPPATQAAVATPMLEAPVTGWFRGCGGVAIAGALPKLKDRPSFNTTQ